MPAQHEFSGFYIFYFSLCCFQQKKLKIRGNALATKFPFCTAVLSEADARVDQFLPAGGVTVVPPLPLRIILAV